MILHVKYNRLKIREQSPKYPEVAKATGRNGTFTTIKMYQKAYMDMQHSQLLLKLIRQISNIKDQTIFLYNDELKTVSAKYVKEILQRADYRPFNTFLHSSSLKYVAFFTTFSWQKGNKHRLMPSIFAKMFSSRTYSNLLVLKLCQICSSLFSKRGKK